jgi:DNA-binding transcriptional regulator GbsR (MarR family)
VIVGADIFPDIYPDIYKELSHFENFFHRIGFKRVDGSVFGLLVLAQKPLTSEEIEESLKLSQSAVSLSLKTLTHFGAIETRDLRENSKAKDHTAKEDSLAIVASLFKKREEEYIIEFKQMAQRVLDKSKGDENAARRKRMQSIISTCEIAESVINFVITIAHNKSRETHEQYTAQYEAIIRRLPKALDMIATTAVPLTDLTNSLKENITERFKNNFKGLL